MRRRSCLIFSFVIFIIIFFYLLLPTEARAFQVLFQDDFNDGDAAGWLEYSPWGYWKVENWEYQGSAVLQSNPEIPSYSVAGDRSWTNYAVSAKVKGEEGVDKIILFRVNESNNAYLLDLRSQFFSGGNDLVLVQRLGLGTSGTRIIKGAPYVNYPGQWYELKAVAENTEAGVEIKAYVDGNLVLEYLDLINPLLTGAVGFEVWPGGYSLPTLGLRTTTSYDDITVTSLAPEPDPIILLPGLGASWNKDALICNAEVEWDKWEMMPGIHHYDGIIQTFQEALGDDFHVFFYDWTKPVDQIADDLKTFIDEVVNPPPGTEIDLVGHSLGGLVARAYIQNNPADHGVDQLITLGSPHRGTPQAYYAWEGADFGELLSPLQAIAASILTIATRGSGQNLVETVQTQVSSLKDLLPIFNFLKDNQTGTEISYLGMNQQNEWLQDPDVTPIPGDLLSHFNPFVGLSGDTPRWLQVLERSRVDVLFGRWEDGRPVATEYDIGDGTVLAESATIAGAQETNLPGLSHSDLVVTTQAQSAILEELGITGVTPTPGSDDFSKRAFTAALIPPSCPSGPSTLTVRLTDPQGRSAGHSVPANIPGVIYHPQDHLIIVPGAIRGNYTVEVLGEPGEEYRLIIGGVGETEDIWIQRRGTIDSKGIAVFKEKFSQDVQEIKINLLQLARSSLDAVKNKKVNPLIQKTQTHIVQAEKFIGRDDSDNAARQLELAVNSIDNLQAQVTNWQATGQISQEEAGKILFETTQVRDYLLQTLEILGE